MEVGFTNEETKEFQNFNSRKNGIQNIYKYQKQFDIKFANSKYPKKSVIVFDGNVVFGHFPSRDGCKLQDQGKRTIKIASKVDIHMVENFQAKIKLCLKISIHYKTLQMNHGSWFYQRGNQRISKLQ
jgi:hypothetical protein